MDEKALLKSIVDTPTGDVLLAVDDADGKVDFNTLLELLGGEHSDATRVAGQMRKHGIAAPNRNINQGVNLTELGRRIAKAVRSSRTDGEARVDTVERALLAWLAESSHPSGMEEFVGQTGATAYGVPFTNEEVQRASDSLTDEGYIESSGLWGRDSGVRPKITPKGRRALRADLPLSEYSRIGTTQNYDLSHHSTITGGTQAAVQIGGSHNAQHVTTNVSVELRTQVNAAVSDLLRQLEASGLDAPALRHDLEEVQAESGKPDASEEALRSKVGTAALTALTTEGAQFVMQKLAGVAGLLTGIN